MAKLNKQILYFQWDNTTEQLYLWDSFELRQNFLEDTYTFDCDNTDFTFLPSSTAAITETVNLAYTPTTPLPVGNYTFNCTAEAGIYDLPFTIELEVIELDPVDPPDPPTPIEIPEVPKYVIYNEDFKLEIWNSAYFQAEPIEIRGSVKHNYTERKDLLQSIVASHLDIQLEADENVTLTELYSEEERAFSIVLYKGTQIVFKGYLKPDGIWEDFVSDKWEISLDAIDGLSTLKNLSFVKENGLTFDGLISQYDCVYYALKRIGYELPINISDDLPVYTGFAGMETILKSVLVNTERFYQDDDKVMDCEAVLNSVLELYNATIVQMNGEWWIYRTIDVKPVMNFKKYEAFDDGIPVVWNAALEIGSHINNYDVHHIGANQKKSIDASIQAFRVNYKYGNTKSIITNPNLIMGTGLTAEGWSITSNGGAVIRNPSGKGIMIMSALTAGEEIITTDQIIPVFVNDKIDIGFKVFI